MPSSTVKKGSITELLCTCKFIEHGCIVSIPYGNNVGYDFIAEYQGTLIRIQVKSSHEEAGAIVFSCRRSRMNCHGVYHKTYTKKEIDFFATVFNDVCYLVPVEECNTVKYLRFENSKNNQKSKIYLAKDYELAVQLDKLKWRNGSATDL